MNRTIFYLLSFLVIFSLLSTGSTLYAKESQIKIGVISAQKIIEESKAGQNARKALEAELAKHQAALQKDREQLEAAKAEIEKKSSVWSEEVRGEKEREYQKRVREFSLKSEDAKYEVQQLEKKIMEPILKNLKKVIDTVGEQQGFTFIAEKSRSGMLYTDKSIDITELVRKELDSLK